MFKSEKPISAITVLIERLTKDEYDIDDVSDLPTLIESIRLQKSTGPTEAARAIRKKLKYGDTHRQLRALTILDDLIQNAGPGFQRSFADEPLLERLRYIPTDPAADNEVKAKCQSLYRQWAVSYKETPGMQQIATLYKQLPQRKKVPTKETSRVLRETEQDEDEDEPQSPRKGSIAAAADGERRRASVAEYHSAASNLAFGPAGYVPQRGGSFIPPSNIKLSKKEKEKKNKFKGKGFNFEKEKPEINNVITQASIESTGLLNALKHINREKERVSDNGNCRRRFDICKQLRRQTFRFCSLVEDESYLGTLLNANDQLSDALILYEQLDKSFDYDSDSEDYEDPDGKASRGHARKPSSASPTGPASPSARQFAGLSLQDDRGPQLPQRPSFTPTFTMTPPEGKGKERTLPDQPPEDDDDDPFADRNEASTPNLEREEPRW